MKTRLILFLTFLGGLTLMSFTTSAPSPDISDSHTYLYSPYSYLEDSTSVDFCPILEYSQEVSVPYVNSLLAPASASAPTPYCGFYQPNPSNLSIVIDISAGERLTYLNDNDPNGAEGETYLLILEQQRGEPNPTGTWKINQLTATHDMHFYFAYDDTLKYVLDDLYNTYVLVN